MNRAPAGPSENCALYRRLGFGGGRSASTLALAEPLPNARARMAPLRGGTIFMKFLYREAFSHLDFLWGHVDFHMRSEIATGAQMELSTLLAVHNLRRRHCYLW